MKKNIALVTGGFTGESVISLKSAEVIEKNIDLNKFDVYKIIITTSSWYYENLEGNRFEINKNDFSLKLKSATINFDGIFIGLHGSPGEDGKLQGYFDLIGLPYTTCDATTSAITMNKGYTKAVVNGIENLHVARSVQLFTNAPHTAYTLLSKLTLPLFIKPNSGGSSIGMSKVKAAEELVDALEKAFNEDK